MTVSSSIATDILPTNPNGTVGSSDTTTSNVSITTDNITGYTLSLSSSSATAPALTGDNGSISSITTEQSSISNFTSGTWGYKPTKKNGETWNNLSVTSGSTTYTSGYFLPAPTTTGDTLDTTEEANSTANEYNIAVATKVGSETAVGSYSSSFIITALTNELPTITFDLAYANAGKTKVSGTDYYSLQDMTPEICSSIELLQTGTLIDIRDNNKTYSVAKLDDGNCWITQNLTLGSDTLGEITLTSSDSDVSSDFTLSAPTATSFSSSNYDVVNYRNYTTYSTNYYNWYTATAGTGTQSTSAYTAATSSICPKGWRLPNGSPAAGTAGEYAELFYAAGITSTLATSTSNVRYADGGFAKMTAAPYNIANTYGYFNTTSTAPTSTSYTYFWTNRTYSSTNYAWSTYIGSSNVYLNDHGYKYQGLPVRCVAYKAGTQPTITYDANGGTGSIASQTASSASEFAQDFTLSDGTGISRNNYALLGWSTDSAATEPEYALGGTIQTSTNKTLYAIWLDISSYTTFDSAFADNGKSRDTTTGLYKMQDMDSTICSNVTTTTSQYWAQTTQLVDTRDGSTYHVSKLPDGKCWMLDNLALDLADSTVQSNLTSSTTNASDTTLNYLKNGGGTSSDKYAMSAVSEWDGPISYSAPLINTSNKDTVPSGAMSGSSGNNKVGVYYNYCAASAGSYCYGNGMSSSGSPSGNATEDVCPAGWRMPTGGSSGEYKALYTAYSGNATNFKAALSTPLSGYLIGARPVMDEGSNGYFWSSTYDSSYDMYILCVSSSYVSPTNSYSRENGYSVRCVAQ